MPSVCDLSSFSEVELAHALMGCDGETEPWYFRVVARELARRVIMHWADTEPGTKRAFEEKEKGERNGK